MYITDQAASKSAFFTSRSTIVFTDSVLPGWCLEPGVTARFGLRATFKPTYQLAGQFALIDE